MNQKQQLSTITAHSPIDEAEAIHQQAIYAFVESHPDFYKRRLTIGHVTASAWIINPACTHALLLHHKKLDRWLQPGGHIEEDIDVLAAALREAKEETGITNLTVASEKIFDIDIHTIPGNQKESEHQHFDIRYLFEAELDSIPVVSDESNDVRWFTLKEITSNNDEASIQRMVLKTNDLRKSRFSR